MKFSDIKPFIRAGSYEVDITLDYLETWIERHEKFRG